MVPHVSKGLMRLAADQRLLIKKKTMTDPEPKPPILFVTLSLARGGTEGHICEIAPRLAARGWPVTVYCLIEGGPLATGLAAQGVTVEVPTGRLQNAARALPNSVRALAAAPHLLPVLRKMTRGIVHFFLPAAYLVGAPLSLLARIPVRIMSRRSQNDYQYSRPLAARVERLLHGQMTAILGNSRRLVRELVDGEGCAPDHAGLIYNGVDTGRFESCRPRSDMRRELGLSDSHFVIVTVANLIPYKGHEDLLRGLAMVKSELPPQWTLLCVGRDDGIGGTLQALAAGLGIGPNVTFLGSRADVPDLLAAADASVLASSSNEGFSNAVLEAMAAGLPLVVTDVGGNAEAVIHGVHGTVVPPRDAPALGRAIRDIATDPAKATAMGEAGRRRVAEHFTIEGCVAAYENVYAGLLKGQSVADLAPVGPRDDRIVT